VSATVGVAASVNWSDTVEVIDTPWTIKQQRGAAHGLEDHRLLSEAPLAVGERDRPLLGQPHARTLSRLTTAALAP
jgi:hypothetical protein